MKALIFDIRRFCVNDGPGIRTTVFFEGCPLRCLWCHNPESQLNKPEPFLRMDKLEGKFFEHEEQIGYEIDLDELLEILFRDRAFMEESGGGVTLSGGEPLWQWKFSAALAQKLSESGIHVAVDTCGYVQLRVFEAILPYTHLFLYDLKGYDNHRHKENTGASNSLILENLEYLIHQRANIILRYPVIPGYTDSEDDVRGILSIMKRNSDILREIHLLPYHKLGQNKYRGLQASNPMPENIPDTDESVGHIESIFKSNHFIVKIGG